MCYPKPGPRCSNHAKQSLDSAKKALMKAKKEGNKNLEQVAIIDLKNAMNDYDSTPAGQTDLVNKIEETKAFIEIGDSGGIDLPAMESRLDSYEKRKARGELKREISMEQYKAMNHPNANIDYNGKILYKDNRGVPHREDGPAYIGTDGAKEWFKHGEFHRDGGPAIIDKDGGEHYYVNGKLHRDGGPARIKADGTQEWYQNGEHHREGGPAVTKPDGRIEYWDHGKYLGDKDPRI